MSSGHAAAGSQALVSAFVFSSLQITDDDLTFLLGNKIENWPGHLKRCRGCETISRRIFI